MSRVASALRRLQSGNLLRIVVNNTLWQIGAKVLRMLINLLIGIWVARFLGPGNFGLLNFAIASVALFSPIADFGVQSVVVRELIKTPNRRRSILAGALALRTAGAAAATLLIAVYICISRPHDPISQLAVFTVALSLFPQAWDVIDFDYQARMDARPIAIIRTISLLVFTVAKAALIISKAGVVYFALTVAGEAAVSALLMRIAFKRQLPQFSILSAEWVEIGYLLRNCWPLAITSMSVLLYMRIDQVMLGQMLGDRAVGIFSAAVRVSESWFFIPMAFLAAASPVLTMELKHSERRFTEKLVLFTRLMFLLSLAFAGALAIWSHQLVEFLYGTSYAAAESVLKIHAWAGIFATLGLASDPWFVNTGMLKVRMIYTIIGSAVNVALNMYFIPRYGVFGSAIATLISYSVSGFWLNAFTRKTMPVFLVQIRACLGFR